MDSRSTTVAPFDGGIVTDGSQPTALGRLVALADVYGISA